ncbi:MFS general substrate transporter [Rhizoctonia solani]|uniref:MFS general substrate transporter n=1 Tax=Rhizoctonia solani TaxID=456999 RepID=A0A8H7HGV6_9AGAM|nr:MFS general substrate transporter [Rhizoctonia solani]
MPPLYNEKQDVERSSSDIKKDPEHHVHVTATAVDDALRQTMDQAPSEPFTAEAALKLRRKIDKHLLPLMMILYWVQFMDKTTLGNSAILGIRTDTHLDANHKTLADQAVKLCSVSFIHDLVTGWEPYSISHILSSNTRVQNLALQRFPVGKWMSINITCWGIALTLHAACKSFGGLMACRIILGICEGSITAGFMITTSMFYTRAEQSLRVGYWFLMNGTAQIVSGFLSFGVLHIETHGFAPWQWFFIITGVITLGTAAAYFMWFPDSPATAWFLTPGERAMAIERIKVNQTGVENKVWKKDQFVEALTDYKTWLFALFSCLGTIPNSLTNQRSIIINSFGFSTLQTTLLACVDGVVEIITIYTGVLLASKWKDGRGYVAALYFVPNILGSVLMNTLPWSNQIGLLFSLWITGVGTTGFVLSLGWLTAVVAGHTKRITVQAIMLSAYCVGNLVGPQMWQEKYKPRNRIPWAVITICYVLCPITLLSLRFLLARENQRRDAEPNEDDIGEVYIEEVLVDGTKIERRVDKAFLDLTDIQNREFRYVL